MRQIKKVVLAYSGGLDTSIIIPWLKENYACEVVAMVADVGQSDDFEAVKKKALASGASKVYVENLQEEFARDFLFPMLKSGAVYEGRYLLGTSIARPLIAKKQIEIAKKEKADAVAHGATGKGNDQVRFELTYKAMDPKMKIIAPWRHWNIKGREDAMHYAKLRNIPVPVTKKKPYSSDQNLWHISFESGILEDPWREPPADMFVMTKSPEKSNSRAQIIEIEFEKGVPIKLNQEKLSPANLIKKLNAIAGEHGVGRIDMVENRLVGIKSRGVYETPAGTVLMLAHRDLESITLDRETSHYKERVSLKYAELIYNGQWFCAFRENLDAFINKTQEKVNGSVRIKLYKGSALVVGRKSSDSLYDPNLATFEEDAAYNQADAEGFINLFGLPIKTEAILRRHALRNFNIGGKK